MQVTTTILFIMFLCSAYTLEIAQGGELPCLNFEPKRRQAALYMHTSREWVIRSLEPLHSLLWVACYVAGGTLRLDLGDFGVHQDVLTICIGNEI